MGRRVNGFESSKVRSHAREIGCEGARLETELDLISQVNSASLEIQIHFLFLQNKSRGYRLLDGYATIS
jgi:hypothetical protein